MDRVAVFLLVLVFLLPIAFADIVLVEPLTQSVSDNQSIELGSVQPGETLELIVSPRPTQVGGLWRAVEAIELPSGWTASVLRGADNFIVLITVPKGAAESSYSFKVKAFAAALAEAGGSFPDEQFSVSVFVRNDLLKSSISSVQQTTKVYEPVSFQLTLLNDSVASHDVVIESTLPLQWVEPLRVTVPPKSVQKVSLNVSPNTYGLRNFFFSVKSGLNDSEFKRFNVSLDVQPTLPNKYAVSLYGFPFFTPTLFPYYALNALFGWAAFQ